jgi:hypothetical protein
MPLGSALLHQINEALPEGRIQAGLVAGEIRMNSFDDWKNCNSALALDSGYEVARGQP